MLIVQAALVSNAYFAIAVGVTVGAVLGLLLRLVLSRAAKGRQDQVPSVSAHRRKVFRIILVVYTIVMASLLVCLAILGDGESTVPYVLISIVSALPLVLLSGWIRSSS